MVGLMKDIEAINGLLEICDWRFGGETGPGVSPKGVTSKGKRDKVSKASKNDNRHHHESLERVAPPGHEGAECVWNIILSHQASTSGTTV